MSRTRLPLSAFKPAPPETLAVHPQNEQFAYSDGQAVEDRILAALKGTADLSVGSPELAARIEDWPTEYHFSDARANLLRHLPLGPGVRVLELGAGCGAVTRFLGERGCEVVAVEGSLLRARCASERTRDLPNVSVYCSDFQDVDFSADFDVVTLIGVLEYAPKFFAGEDPFGACLQVARSALASGGTLLVAIENQLGLKYFAGATEDHLGTHFSGIENRYRPDGVRTLGRRQIGRTLQAAGFADLAFQYPFPDYKLPAALVFEPALQRGDFRASELVRHLYARDYAGKDLRAIDAAQVWPVLEDNGLMGDMANSFLVLARREASGAGEAACSPGLLALAYSVGRAKPFQTQTAFRVEQGNSIVCEKTLVYPLDAQARPATPGIVHRMTRDAYVCGSTLHSRITAALRAGDQQGVISLLNGWLEFLRSLTPQRPGGWDDRLPGQYWDCTPANLIEARDGLHYFDAEWVTDPGPSLSNLLLHYLSILAFREATAPYFRSCFPPGGASIGWIAGELALSLTQDVLDDYARHANRLNGAIFPLNPPLLLDARNYRAMRRPAGSVAGGVGFPRRVAARLARGVSRTFDRARRMLLL